MHAIKPACPCDYCMYKTPCKAAYIYGKERFQVSGNLHKCSYIITHFVHKENTHIAVFRNRASPLSVSQPAL